MPDDRHGGGGVHRSAVSTPCIPAVELKFSIRWPEARAAKAAVLRVHLALVHLYGIYIYIYIWPPAKLCCAQNAADSQLSLSVWTVTYCAYPNVVHQISFYQILCIKISALHGNFSDHAQCFEMYVIRAMYRTVPHELLVQSMSQPPKNVY